MQTILIVEDELPITEIITDILSDAGHKVVVAGNGQEALLCLQSERPDLIISDIMMPVMDGRELCKRLQTHPIYSSIPVVLMSAAYKSINLDGYKHASFLKKPFDVTELLAAVSHTIGAGPSTS